MGVKTLTLVANAPTVVALGTETDSVAVYNRSTVDNVYVTLANTNPVADADGVYFVPPGARRQIYRGKLTGSEVRVISSGTPKIEVEWPS